MVCETLACGLASGTVRRCASAVEEVARGMAIATTPRTNGEALMSGHYLSARRAMPGSRQQPLTATIARTPPRRGRAGRSVPPRAPRARRIVSHDDGASVGAADCVSSSADENDRVDVDPGRGRVQRARAVAVSAADPDDGRARRTAV